MLNRRHFVQSVGAILVAHACRISIARADSTSAADTDWPAAHGPQGNFSTRRGGRAIVDDLSQSRLVWTSEDADLGLAKGSASGYLRMLVEYSHPGSCSGAIVADDRVFCASFRPAGEVWAENATIYQLSKQPWTDAQRAARLTVAARWSTRSVVIT